MLTHNAIKSIRALHAAKGRAQAKQFIGEGLRVCSTLIESTCQLNRLYVTEEQHDLALKIAHAKYVSLISHEDMRKIAVSSTPSGMLGVFSIPHHPLPEKLSSGLVLCNISDPGNMGTLIRSSIAFGHPEIIVIDGVDIWNPKVVQASAGTIGYARIYDISWEQLASHSQRPPLAALVPRGGAPISAKHRDTLLVVGSEAHGLPEAWLEQCDQQLTLPMPGKAESLNAAIAGSIALYLIS